MSSNGPLKETFLVQLKTVDIRSGELTGTLAKMLSSQEGVDTAMSLQGEDALSLIDILDHALEDPDMELDLRETIFRIVRKVCGLQSILPRSCILSDNITKEGDIAFTSRGFADVWEGHHNGNRVCIKAFRIFAAENLFKIKQNLFQEIPIWRRLSHPNILTVLGVSPKLFSLCIITRWMIDGNIVDFISRHPEVNRLCLVRPISVLPQKSPDPETWLKLAEVASGLQYLHTMDIIHSDLKPTNILIDHDFRPRLTDYGLAAIILNPNNLDPGSMATPSAGTVRYMAPELLNPSGFGLEESISTKKSDIYAFGMVTYQIITGQQPFPGVNDGLIIYNVVTGERPDRPPDPNGCISDNVWDLISRCWSSLLISRPDARFATNILTDAVGVGRDMLHATADGQGRIIYRRASARTEHVRVDLSDFLHAHETWYQHNDRKEAQEFADRLGEALDSVDPHGENRKQCLKYLQRLCGAFGILPASFVLPPTSIECEDTPFAAGGFSDVYKATFNGAPVVMKTLRVNAQIDQEKLYKLLVREVVGWRWLRHENILPFLGVSLEPPLFSIISDRMESGSIMNFIRRQPNFNRLHLLVGAVTGLRYLHEHSIVHGDLKGANILIDSGCCARLADFGLSVAIDESITGSAAASRATRGTVRWMAPELLDPNKFGFKGKFLKQLPSVSTDVYAIGMTILEVLTGCRPFDNYPTMYTVIVKVVDGVRPKRPPLGFSDTLWELLTASWVKERARKRRRRPSVSTVLDRLKESVDKWEKSIVPLVPKQWDESPTVSDSITVLAEFSGEETTRPRITNAFKEFFRLDRNAPETP